MSTGFAPDLDGRLRAIPAHDGVAAKGLAYDALGRLVSATVAGVTRTYAYDPLDRLVTVSEGGNPAVRFRYVGLTSSVAQLLDGAWAVTTNIGTDWSGAPLADWAAGGSGWRRYLSNGHGDLVDTAAANGTISASLRLDPWGVPLRAVPAGCPSFGFQGSWTDRSTTLVYARARWYDPVLATFTSEDALAGEIADPPSRHLYAYGGGDPVDRADVDGERWWKVDERIRNLTREERFFVNSGKVIICDMVGNFARLKPEVELVIKGGCTGIELLALSIFATTSVDVQLLQRTVIMKGDTPGREVMWAVTPGVAAEVRSTKQKYTSFARSPSLIYSERFNDPRHRDSGMGRMLELSWARCAEPTWLFGARQWGPDTERDATSRKGPRGYCHGYSARVMGYADPWNGRGWYQRVTTRWPRYFRVGDSEAWHLKWR